MECRLRDLEVRRGNGQTAADGASTEMPYEVDTYVMDRRGRWLCELAVFAPKITVPGMADLIP